MADVVGLTIIKKFTYRADATEEFSNTYHLTGALPADDAAWVALFNALVAQEKTIYDSAAAVIAGYGYTSDDATQHAQWVHDISGSPVPGTLAVTSQPPAPGDSAVWVRWKTSRSNSRGKPIYLRKYFHRAYMNGTAQYDTVMTGQRTALLAFGTKLMDGSFLDARTIRSRAHAETILSRDASTWLTTRTLKRRGKRPS